MMATCNDAFSEQMKLEITSFFSLDHFCLDQFVLDLIKFDPYNWMRTSQNSHSHFCAPPIKYLVKTHMNENKNAICYFRKGFAQL